MDCGGCGCDSDNDSNEQLLPNEILVMIAMCGWRAFNNIRLMSQGFNKELVVRHVMDRFTVIRVGKVKHFKHLIKEYYKLIVVDSKDVFVFKNGKLTKNIVYTVPKACNNYLWKFKKITRWYEENGKYYEEEVTFDNGGAVRATHSVSKAPSCRLLVTTNIDLTAYDRAIKEPKHKFFLYN
ncbi:Hypothetical protein FSTVST1_463 [Faustovirus ST1]|nr:Hypothetical protein FSTVST1_463 [Faustovirus ST1]